MTQLLPKQSVPSKIKNTLNDAVGKVIQMIPKLLEIPGFEQVVQTQLEGEIPAIIAIHNTKKGPALGGVRFYPYPHVDAALKDVLNLAEAMTYKAALADLPLGGGKAVILGDPQKVKTRELLESFGDFVEKLGGKYITAKDVGMKLEDLDIIAERTSFVSGTTQGGSGDPSPMTAYGVYQGIKACATYVWKNASLQGLRIVVQGLGGVGWEVARLLREEGGVVYACDVNQDLLRKGSQKLEIIPFDPITLLNQTGDIFTPCAMGEVVNARVIPHLRKNGIRVIAGGANNQLSHEQADGWRLHRERILYAPDYVINSGGLINVACELEGYDAHKARQKTEKIYSVLLEIFEQSRRQDKPTVLIAHELALKRLRGESHGTGRETKTSAMHYNASVSS